MTWYWRNLGFIFKAPGPLSLSCKSTSMARFLGAGEVYLTGPGALEPPEMASAVATLSVLSAR